jgi:hypothetical protein
VVSEYMPTHPFARRVGWEVLCGQLPGSRKPVGRWFESSLGRKLFSKKLKQKGADLRNSGQLPLQGRFVMSRAQLIADAFDLQRRSRLCNTPGCGKLPAKRVTIFEENRISGNRKPLATVYLCSEHYSTRVPVFLTEANRLRETGRVIDKKVQDIGLITY